MPRNDLTSYPKKVGYKKHPGMVAWLLHRVTGVILVMYFVFHILGSSGFCPFLPTIVQNTCVKGIVIFSIFCHGLNGFRIILMELCNAADRAVFKKYIYVVVGLTVALSAYGFTKLI